MNNTTQNPAQIRKNTTCLAIGFLITLPLAFPVIASDAIGPGDSNSTWVVGIHAGAVNNPFSGEDTEYYAFPNVEYRGERFFVKEGNLGLQFHRDNGFSVGAFLTHHASFLSDDDDYRNNERLAGISERDSTLDLGLYLLHDSPLGRLRLAVMDEITGEHGGQSADIRYTFNLKADKLHINPTIGANWQSAEMVDHFYGISVSEAREDRKAYRGHSALSVYTGLRARYEVTEHWDVNANAAYVHLGSGIKDSSVINDSGVWVSTLGVNYNF